MRFALIMALALSQAGLAKGVGVDFDKLAWGRPTGGLQISLLPRGATAGGKFDFYCVLRNVGAATVKLHAGAKQNDAFGWLIFQQGREKYFSARIDIGNDVSPWPGELASDKIINVLCRDVGGLELYKYRRGVKFISAWREGGKITQPPAGPVRNVLKTGPAFACFVLRIKPPGGTEMQLKSSHLQFTVVPPDFSKLDAEARQSFTAKLLRRFDRDAWSAREAHRAAVRIGKPIAPRLIEAVFEKTRPGYSRLWLATAVADIRDESCAEALIKLLQDSTVRLIVAYHGPKQRSDKLDDAIVTRAGQLKKTRFTGYALLGFLAFRKSAPAELLKLGLDSPDARTRAAAAETLKKLGGGTSTLEALLRLLKDKNPRVRATAARVLGNVNNRSPKILGALVAALDNSDDLTRKRICEALEQLTDVKNPYNPNAAAAEKQKTIQAWKDWWKTRRKTAN